MGNHPPPRRNQTGGLTPERHRRPAPNIPAAGPNELIPVAHARRPDLNQHLVPSEGTRPRYIDHSNIVTGAANSRYEHPVPPPYSSISAAAAGAMCPASMPAAARSSAVVPQPGSSDTPRG